MALPALLLAAVPFVAYAQYGDHDERGERREWREHREHPRYLHALADLRAARWLLSQRADTRAEARDEDAAVYEIDKAYNEITRAAINDGKDLRAPVSMDVPPERAGRLHRALDLLRQIRDDVAREEDDPYTRGLRDRAVQHVDEAIHATQRAIEDKRWGG
jgi:hypothetical protein